MQASYAHFAIEGGWSTWISIACTFRGMLQGLMRRSRLLLVLPLLWCISLPRNTEAIGHCPDLDPLSFGEILHNGNTTLPPSNPDTTFTYSCARGYNLVNATGSVLTDGTTVCLQSMEWTVVGVACMVISCGSPPLVANGEVSTTARDYLVGGVVQYRCDPGYSLVVADSTVVLAESSELLTSVCNVRGEWHVVPSCAAVSSGISSFTIVVIVLGIVAGLCLLTLCLFLVFCLWTLKLRRDMNRGDMAEDEVAYAHTHGAITLNNPLVTPKDDESLSNPLYLTPEEMDDFESKKKQTTNHN